MSYHDKLIHILTNFKVLLPNIKVYELGHSSVLKPEAYRQLAIPVHPSDMTIEHIHSSVHKPEVYR